MFTVKTKVLRALTVVTLLLGGAMFPVEGGAAQPASVRGGAPKDNGARLKALLAERLAVAREMSDQTTKAYKAGAISFARVHEATLVVLTAELDLCERDKDRVLVLEKFVAAMKQVEDQVAEQHKAGATAAGTLFKAKLARLEAEIALERAKVRAADPTK